jgi:hypothetical protein
VGPSPDGTRWVACPDGFFLPVKVLGPVFRGKFLAGLRAAFGRGELAFHGRLAPLADPDEFRRRLTASARGDWVVYAKPPFGGPGQVLKYLARYTHRVAISNHRLLGQKDGRVTFRYKDYARGGKRRAMGLTAVEFLRRSLQHVLPAGFVRVRSYGFLANRDRRERLAACRELLGAAAPAAAPAEAPAPATPLEPEVVVTAVRCTTVCPVCGVGRMVAVGELPAEARRVRGPRRRPVAHAAFDTS